MPHLYKNRLQNYAQKRNLTLPEYSSESMGPPHFRRFKSKVTVDGKTFETSEFFTTLKQAENAAAKVAVESISLHGTLEDEVLYKNLLQELAQKGGLRLPAYETNRSGPPHMPTFISTVEIKGERFQGNEAKTKRLAEVDAAKAAYTSLIERGARQLASGQAKQHSTVSPPGEEDKEKNISAKRHRCSVSSERVDAPLQDPISFTSSPPNESTCSKKRKLVCEHKTNMTVPDGAIVLPCSDDERVALRMDENQKQ